MAVIGGQNVVSHILPQDGPYWVLALSTRIGDRTLLKVFLDCRSFGGRMACSALALAVAKPGAAEPAASDELAELARLASSLTPCWTSPLKFHERKSELLMRLRKSARRVALLEAALQRDAGRDVSLPAIGDAAGKWKASLNLLGVKRVANQLNFTHPEWLSESHKLTDQLSRLSDLLATERHLVGLIELYKERSDGVTLCTGAHVDDDGSCHFINMVELDARDDWLPVVTGALNRRIDHVRQQIERLFGEIAG